MVEEERLARARIERAEARIERAEANSQPALSVKRPLLVCVGGDVALLGFTVIASAAAGVAGAGFALVSGLRMGLATLALFLVCK